jgi:uncharacterized DUF497 family protein
MKTGFPDDLAVCVGFEWDAGNADKNWNLHHVAQIECEQPFFTRPVIITRTVMRSGDELRYAALGRTNTERLLAIIFTVRKDLVRVISARDMSRRERRIYEDARQGG